MDYVLLIFLLVGVNIVKCSSPCDSKCKAKQATKSPSKGPSKTSSGSGKSSVNNAHSSGSSGSGKSGCNDVDPCVSVKDANKKYRARCKAAGMMASCLDYCRYDVTKRDLQAAFLHSKCDISEAKDMLLAAANKKNNNYCCKKKKVITGDKAICEPFCNPNSKNWPTKAEAKYLQCLAQFDNIMACHLASCRP